MLRKALTLGMVFIFALSLLLVSMITCFTYDAEAHPLFKCVIDEDITCIVEDPEPEWDCVVYLHHDTG